MLMCQFENVGKERELRELKTIIANLKNDWGCANIEMRNTIKHVCFILCELSFVLILT